MIEHYPSIEELVKAVQEGDDSWDGIPLPEEIVNRMKERYLGGREQYATDQVHTDGRIVNACMFKDSLQDIEEEIIDAIFNVAVEILKNGPNDLILNVADNLIAAYRDLSTLKNRN